MSSSSADVDTLHSIFPDWSAEDCKLVLREAHNDLELAVDRISTGQAQRWGEVSSKSEKKREKRDPSQNPRQQSNRVEFGNGRGRGRGQFPASRGRGSDIRGRGRGRGGFVGSSAPGQSTSGQAQANATETGITWDSIKTTTTDTASSAWDASNTEDLKPALMGDGVQDAASTWSDAATKADSVAEGVSATTQDIAKAKSRIIPTGSKTSWASIAKPAQLPPQPSLSGPTPKVTRAAKETKLPEPSAQEQRAVGSQVSEQAQGSPSSGNAPLTEKNLEAVEEAQVKQGLPVPDPITAASQVSLQGQPTTGPSSTVGAPGTPAAASSGPPGLNLKQTARGGTPLGGRRLTQDAPVVMPGSERLTSDRLGVQFGSLGLGEDEVYEEKSETAQPATQKDMSIEQQSSQRQELPSQTSLNRQSIQEVKQPGFDHFGGAPSPYGGYGMQGPQGAGGHGQSPFGGFNGNAGEPYPGMSSFYGQQSQQEQSRNHYGGQVPQQNYYELQAAHAQQQSHQGQQAPYGQQAGSVSSPAPASASSARPTDLAHQHSRFGTNDSASSPVAAHINSHNSGPSIGGPGGYPNGMAMYGQNPYGAYNPYGYGAYGYPQQSQYGYTPNMYGQQNRGGYGGQGGYPGQHEQVSSAGFGTSGRSQQESYGSQRSGGVSGIGMQTQSSQQSHHNPQQGGAFGNDFLATSAAPRAAYGQNSSEDAFNRAPSSTHTPQKEAVRPVQHQYGSQQGGLGGQSQQAYGAYNSQSPYGSYGAGYGQQNRNGSQWGSQGY